MYVKNIYKAKMCGKNNFGVFLFTYMYVLQKSCTLHFCKT